MLRKEINEMKKNEINLIRELISNYFSTHFPKGLVDQWNDKKVVDFFQLKFRQDTDFRPVARLTISNYDLMERKHRFLNGDANKPAELIVLHQAIGLIKAASDSNIPPVSVEFKRDTGETFIITVSFGYDAFDDAYICSLTGEMMTSYIQSLKTRECIGLALYFVDDSDNELLLAEFSSSSWLDKEKIFLEDICIVPPVDLIKSGSEKIILKELYE